MLLGSTILVMNDYVPPTASASAPAYSGAEVSGELGRYDQVALSITVDDADAGGGYVNLVAEHSADGEVWVPLITPGAPPLEPLMKFPVFYSNKALGQTELPANALAFVRIGFYFTGTTTSGRVRAQATGRGAAPRIAHPVYTVTVEGTT